MNPTFQTPEHHLRAKTEPAEYLLRLRESRATRYAHRKRISQRQRRMWNRRRQVFPK